MEGAVEREPAMVYLQVVDLAELCFVAATDREAALTRGDWYEEAKNAQMFNPLKSNAELQNNVFLPCIDVNYKKRAVYHSDDHGHCRSCDRDAKRPGVTFWCNVFKYKQNSIRSIGEKENIMFYPKTSLEGYHAKVSKERQMSLSIDISQGS